MIELAVSTTRFASVSPWAARGMLVVLAALVSFGWLLPPSLPQLDRAHNGGGNLRFYRAVVERMHRGEPYETAAVRELRSEHGALKPFVTVRPPLLATMLASLPSERAGAILLALLAVTVLLAWAVTLHEIQTGILPLVAMTLVLFTGVGESIAAGGISLMHEAWSGLLMALSLVAWANKRIAASVALGLLAAMVRELAMPYLLVMAVLALVERRRLEALSFALALAAAVGALAWHAQAVQALAASTDLTSAGWVKFSGWRFVLATARWNFIVFVLGAWTTALIVPMALAGAIGAKNGLGLRLAALLLGYTLGFAVIGRPENIFWGLMTAPLVAVGLCFAPTALGDLIRRAAGRPLAPAPMAGKSTTDALER
jgi:hypothetical protein